MSLIKTGAVFDPDTNEMTYDPNNIDHTNRNMYYRISEEKKKKKLDGDVEWNSDFDDTDCEPLDPKAANEPSPLLCCIDKALKHPGDVVLCTILQHRKERTFHAVYTHPNCKLATWADTKKKLYPLYLEPPLLMYPGWDRLPALISDAVSPGIRFGNQSAPAEYLSKCQEADLKVCVIDLTNRRLAWSMPATAACGLLYIAVTAGDSGLSEDPKCGVLSLFVGHMVPLMAELEGKGWDILVHCEEGLHRSCPIPNSKPN